MQWYAKEANDVLRQLHSTSAGLSANIARDLLERHGSNILPEGQRDSWWRLFFRQFGNSFIYILLIAAVILSVLGDFLDVVIIAAVLLLNAVIGSLQEGRAQATLASLKKFTETMATVKRDGQEVSLPSSQIVPGDVIILSKGQRIPADARIIAATELKVDEASLTGESEPVHKQVKPLLVQQLPASDQKNMVFSGTHVIAGEGLAVVVATGLNTVVGHIAKKIATIDAEIPLKAKIRRLTRAIMVVVFVLIAIMMGYSLLTDLPLQEMFKTAVALAVSSVPEGLPVVITLVLATGVWRMSKHNALVKRLQAVEALGQARIIAVDKTGTLTRNQMVIEKVYVNGTFFSISGFGYDPTGDIVEDETKKEATHSPEIHMIAQAAAFCANAHIMRDDQTHTSNVTGDPTEAALLIFAEKAGIIRDELRRTHPLLKDIPFSHESKYHATMHETDGRVTTVVVGSPEEVMALCNTIWNPDGKPKPLTRADKEDIEQTITGMADGALRVLACAVRESDAANNQPLPGGNLTFVGLYGMKDGLRPEVHTALQQAHEAGLKVVMITGDHVATARSIAREAGIYRKGDKILSGNDLLRLSDNELAGYLPNTTVFARVTPDHKLRIVQAYQGVGEVIAMTGDGVNDAPSLVAADLGVAMGKIGTDVAKEAADIVLLDDNFGSIISAIEEGRHIYRTIRKVTLYLLATSAGEVLAVLATIFTGMPLPILAAQILWLNLVTDGFLDIALGMDPKNPDLLQERPGKPRLAGGTSIIRIVLMALIMAIGSFWIFTHYLPTGLEKARTMTLTVLAMFQWFNVWNCRSEYKSVFTSNPFSNRYLVGAQLLVVGLQATAIYVAFFQFALRTVPIEARDWLLATVIASTILFGEEARKIIHRLLMRPRTYYSGTQCLGTTIYRKIN